jgi:hypothetical protein
MSNGSDGVNLFLRAGVEEIRHLWKKSEMKILKLV